MDTTEKIVFYGLSVAPIFDRDVPTKKTKIVCWSAGKADPQYGILNGNFVMGITLEEAVDKAVERSLLKKKPSFQEVLDENALIYKAAKAAADTAAKVAKGKK